MKRAAYGLHAKCVGYMGLVLVWAERRNNAHTLPITRQLWVVFLQSASFISVLSVFLFIVYILTLHLSKLRMHSSTHYRGKEMATLC